MAHNKHQEKAFLCVSYNILGYLGYEKVKAAGQSHLNHCIRSSLDYWPNP